VGHRIGPPVIGVLGHYGNANLGDEAIIHAVIEEIRRRWEHATLYAISNRPADTAWRHLVPAVSIHTGELLEAGEGAPHVPRVSMSPGTGRKAGPVGLWRLPALRMARRGAARIVHAVAWIGAEALSAWRSFRQVRRFDLLLIAGSNQMLDNFGGAWEFPYINLKWSILARLAGCRVAWISVGAGPLDSPLGRRFVRAAMRLADYVSVRDEGSRRLLRDIGVKREIAICPDLAHGLVHDQGRAAGWDRGGGRPIVAINPMPVYDARYWFESSPEKSRRYLTEVAAFAAALLKDGYGVFFLATHPMDATVAEDILGVMEAEHGQRPWDRDPVRSPTTVPQLLREMESADLIVATRFHGAVLSLRVERPVLAICYYRKTRELLADFGQGPDFAVTLEEFRAEDGLDRLRLLEARAQALIPIMRQKSADCRAALREQYDRVFELVAGWDA
jgi:polysaccharide pyruvyl transferase WcaK-like protein